MKWALLKSVENLLSKWNLPGMVQQEEGNKCSILKR